MRRKLRELAKIGGDSKIRVEVSYTYGRLKLYRCNQEQDKNEE